MSLLKAAVLYAMMAHADAGSVQLPETPAPPVQETGLVSWYGNGAFHGDQTANGEVFQPDTFTCAHRTLPFDTMVLVTNPATRKRAWCRVNDRGPYGALMLDGSWAIRFTADEMGQWRGIMDLSSATADALDSKSKGLQRMELRYWTRHRKPAFHMAAIAP